MIYLAASPEVDQVTGKYFMDLRPIRSKNRSHDEQLRKDLWRVSEELTGLSEEGAA